VGGPWQGLHGFDVAVWSAIIIVAKSLNSGIPLDLAYDLGRLNLVQVALACVGDKGGSAV
jgi:hypothetical protein